MSVTFAAVLTLDVDQIAFFSKGRSKMAISARLAVGLGWSERRFSGHFSRGLHSMINNMSGKAWFDQVYSL